MMILQKLKVSIPYILGVTLFFNTYWFSKIAAEESNNELSAESACDMLEELSEISKIEYKISLIERKINPQLSYIIAEKVYRYSKQANKESDLVLSIMAVESWFDPNATSPTGAKGLMQVMPFWEKILNVKDLYDMDDNIISGIKILSKYEKRFKKTDLALAAYNRGPEKVKEDLHNRIDPRNKYVWDISRMYKRLRKIKFGTITYVAKT